MDNNYQHKWVKVEGVETHYIEAGQGETLVLVHGGGASSCGEVNYGDVIPLLANNFHVVAPDIVGYGLTEPRGPQDYSGKSQGNFLIKIIEILDVGPVFLGGNSHGGFLVQYVAHERPDLVKKLVIINSLNGTFPIDKLPDSSRYIYAPGGHQYNEPKISETRKNLENFYAHKDLVTDGRVNLSYQIALKNYEYAHKRGKAVSSTPEDATKNLSYNGKHISEWASELEMPVLLTWSEPGSKIEWGLEHFFKVPGCEMHIFPWSGHHVQTDQKDRWAQVVTNWLKTPPANPP